MTMILKYLKNNKSLFLIIITILLNSCNRNDNAVINKKKTIRVYNSTNNNLILGELIKDSIPIGLWTYYDNKDNAILSINHIYEENGKLSLSIKQYDKNKVIYESHYIDGRLIDEKKYLDYQSISVDNGKYLYKTFLASFFEANNLIKDVSTLEKNYLIGKIDSLKKDHKILPEFTSNEKESIFLYLKSLDKPLNN